MSAVALSADITQALRELEEAFPGQVTVVSDDANGAIVRIEGVELSSRWTPQRGDLWFLIPFHYPDAAIYPYYVTGAAGTGLQALQPASWRGMPATQVSLRHNGWNPQVDTALGSVRQALAWLRSQ